MLSLSKHLVQELRSVGNKILNNEVQDYINANLNADLHSLLLKKSPFPEVSMQEIVQQIKGKQVAQKKFPFLLKDGIIFPSQLNLEQSSSEKTAFYKSEILKGKKFIDLTRVLELMPIICPKILKK